MLNQRYLLTAVISLSYPITLLTQQPSSTTVVAATAQPTTYRSQLFPTFEAWHQAVKRLPSYIDLHQQGQIKKKLTTASNYQTSAFPKLANGLYDATELANALNAYFAAEKSGVLANSANWLNGTLPPASFFDPNQAYFTQPAAPFLPFAQKLKLPVGATVILRADVHGDAISLVNQIAHLQRLGYMDPHDGFKLASPNTYLLFLGDYIDRGLYGAEVIYTVLRLKLANPTQVFMARGNHEDINMAKKQGFLTELQTKFGSNANFTPIYRLYEYLPAVIYVGTGHDYYQCCHGGLEIGYDPTKLLSSADSLKFELLGTLRQLDFLNANPQIGKHFLNTDSCQCEVADCSDCEASTGVSTYPIYFENFTPNAPISANGRLVGFMQHHFLLNVDDQGNVNDNITKAEVVNLFQNQSSSAAATMTQAKAKIKGLGLDSAAANTIIGSETIFMGVLKDQRWVCSKDFTAGVLAAQSSGPNKIRSVIRGHQHGSSQQNLMASLVKSNGLFSMWPLQSTGVHAAIQHSLTRIISDHLVHTLLVAPDNNYGTGSNFNFDTFAILTLNGYPKDQLQIVNTKLKS